MRDLQRRKARGRRGLALVEGVRLVEEALAAGLKFKGAIVSPELERTARGVELRKELESQGVVVQDMAARTFAQFADTDTPQGVVVDTHVTRLAALLKLTTQQTPEKIEHDLMAVVPRAKWTVFSHLLILHGRAVCVARRPKCETCVISRYCPSSRV